MQKARDLHDTGVVLDVLPLGASDGRGFRMDRFFGDLLRLADDEDALAAIAADPVEK